MFTVEEDRILDEGGTELGKYLRVTCGAELDMLTKLSESESFVVMDSIDWQVIPAENVVAAFQDSPCEAFAVSNDAKSAIVALQALETGVDGVVLRTDKVSHIYDLKNFLEREIQAKQAVVLTKGQVKRVLQIGMGDRVCVDLCSLLRPGEGLLVGSFARCLFLVHSECLEVDYVASRPFRVNAGPVHSYVAMPNGKTAYLAELQSGSEVLVVDKHGNTRTVVVGRAKIEARPMILVEASVDGITHSVILQNAETVRLVTNDGHGTKSVAELQEGDEVLFSLQENAARHTGIAIKEQILEK